MRYNPGCSEDSPPIPAAACAWMCPAACGGRLVGSSAACYCPSCANGLPHYFLPLSETASLLPPCSTAKGGVGWVADRQTEAGSAALSFTCESERRVGIRVVLKCFPVTEIEALTVAANVYFVHLLASLQRAQTRGSWARFVRNYNNERIGDGRRGAARLASLASIRGRETKQTSRRFGFTTWSVDFLPKYGREMFTHTPAPNTKKCTTSKCQHICLDVQLNTMRYFFFLTKNVLKFQSSGDVERKHTFSSILTCEMLCN